MLKALFQRAGWVAVGTAVGQGAVLLATPFLARMYPPEEFGLLALLLTISNVATAVACLRYDIVLPSAPDRDIRGLIVLCLGAGLGLAILTSLAITLLSEVPTLSETLKPLAEIWPVVALCIVLAGAFQAAGALLLRLGAYRSVGLLRASQGLAFSALGAVPVIGLMWAHALSFFGGAGALMRLPRRGPDDAGWMEVASRYKSLPALSLPGALLDVIGYSLCIWTIVSVYGQAAGGELSQVQRLVGAPLMLISISLGQILLRQTAELMHDRPALRQLLLRLLGVLAAMSVLAAAVLFLAGKPVIDLVLGERWSISREFIMAASIAVFVRACVSPLSSVLITYRRFGLGLLWQGLYFASALLLFPRVAAVLSFEQFMLFYAVHETVLYGLYLGLIFYSLKE